MSRLVILFELLFLFQFVWSLSGPTMAPAKSFSTEFKGNSSAPRQMYCNGYTCNSNTESCCDASASPCCSLPVTEATCCPDACYEDGVVCCGTYGCYAGTTCCGGSCCNYGYYCTSYLTCDYDWNSSISTGGFSNILLIAVLVPAIFVLILCCVIVGACGYRRRWYSWNTSASYVVVPEPQVYNAPYVQPYQQVVYAQPQSYNGMPPPYSASYAPQAPQYSQPAPRKS